MKTASFNLGAMVVGDIQLKVTNLGIRYIGNTNTNTTNRNVKEKIPSLTRIVLNSTDMQSYDTGTELHHLLSQLFI